MRKFGLLAAAAAGAVLAGCGLGAPEYPEFGSTSYRVEGMTADAGGGAPTRTVIYRDGPRMRVEASLVNYGQAAVVFDESTNAAYVLNPTTSATIATTGSPVTTTATAPPATTTAAPTTTTVPATTVAPPAATTIAGVAVRIQDADAPQPLETAWQALGADNAESSGECEVAGESGHEWRPRQAPAPGVERTACITDDGIVLRVRENERVLWEATSLQRGDQDPTLFGVPPGYQLIDPQAVAAEVGENMQQLDSVTGATPPATTTAPRG